MKLIHVSDLHLVTPGQIHMASDPLLRLRACITRINAEHGDADRVVITGDLSESGAPETYEALRDELRTLAVPVTLTLGNHDSRPNFQRTFPEHIRDGFAQSVTDIGDTRVVILDTLDPGKHGGLLCEARLDWLAAQLGEARDRQMLIFMHHPPAEVGLPVLDGMRLANAAEFRAVLRSYAAVRHIFCGHVHRLITGIWEDIPYTVLRSTNHQGALDFAGKGGQSFEAPLFGIISTSASGITCHFEEFDVGGFEASGDSHS